MTASSQASVASSSLSIKAERKSPKSELERLRQEVDELRRVVGNHPDMWDAYYMRECRQAIKNSILFNKLTDEQINHVAAVCTRVVFPRGAIIQRDEKADQENQRSHTNGRSNNGSSSSSSSKSSSTGQRIMYMLASGEVERWTEIDGVQMRVKSLDQHSVGSMMLLTDEPSHASVRAETEIVAYSLTRENFDALMMAHRDMCLLVARALASFIHCDDQLVISGLLDQKGPPLHARDGTHKSAYIATAVAVFVESFYRSAMNNAINAKLDGGKIAWSLRVWFPNMHVQIPTRIVYITGLKEIRRSFADIDPENVPLPASLTRLGLAIAPGVIMCPLSSVLEAAVARQNTEPLAIRWTRGYPPRLAREIVFGVGINQLSDYCRELSPGFITNQQVRTMTGSIVAGMLAGWLSQVPHNISTMKLMDPSRSYSDCWQNLWKRSLARVPDTVQPEMRPLVAQAMAVFLPLGCARRSMQIGGSFVIINDLLHRMRDTFPW